MKEILRFNQVLKQIYKLLLLHSYEAIGLLCSFSAYMNFLHIDKKNKKINYIKIFNIITKIDVFSHFGNTIQ